MTIEIILEGSGGELDRVKLVCHEDNIADMVIGAIETQPWRLSPGDTIRIKEVA